MEFPSMSRTFLSCPHILADSQNKNFCSSCRNQLYLQKLQLSGPSSLASSRRSNFSVLHAESLMVFVHPSPLGGSVGSRLLYVSGLSLSVSWAIVFQEDGRELSLCRPNPSTTNVSPAVLGREGNRKPILAPHLSYILQFYS